MRHIKKLVMILFFALGYICITAFLSDIGFIKDGKDWFSFGVELTIACALYNLLSCVFEKRKKYFL